MIISQFGHLSSIPPRYIGLFRMADNDFVAAISTFYLFFFLLWSYETINSGYN